MQSRSDIGYFQRSPPEVLLQTFVFSVRSVVEIAQTPARSSAARLDNVILRQKPKDLVLRYDSEDEILR
jgi:hypothetical protein